MTRMTRMIPFYRERGDRPIDLLKDVPLKKKKSELDLKIYLATRPAKQ